MCGAFWTKYVHGFLGSFRKSLQGVPKMSLRKHRPFFKADTAENHYTRQTVNFCKDDKNAMC